MIILLPFLSDLMHTHLFLASGSLWPLRPLVKIIPASLDANLGGFVVVLHYPVVL